MRSEPVRTSRGSLGGSSGPKLGRDCRRRCSFCDTVAGESPVRPSTEAERLVEFCGEVLPLSLLSFSADLLFPFAALTAEMSKEEERLCLPLLALDL